MIALLAVAALAEDPTIQVQGTLQFLPTNLAENVQVRMLGDKDSYLQGEARYSPDRSWFGRAGAGFDVLGHSRWDLRLGLFLGTMGTWDEELRMTARLQGGSEVLLGHHGDRLGAQWRWLVGYGGGAVDRLATENELQVSYRVAGPVHAVGQFVVLDPAFERSEIATGLGVRVEL